MRRGLRSSVKRAPRCRSSRWCCRSMGQAKGALHAHRVLLGHMPGVEMPHEFFPQQGDRFWTPADWAWAGGLLDCLLPSLYYGVPVVPRRFDKFDPEEAFA